MAVTFEQSKCWGKSNGIFETLKPETYISPEFAVVKLKKRRVFF